MLVIEALEKIHRQPLVTAALNAIKEFDGSDKSSTIPWLDQVEMVAERNSTDPVEVGISKLVGIPLRNIITIKCEAGDLIWCKFCQVLTENYSDVPYVSDAMTCYLKIMQGEEKSVTQYLVRAESYLEKINHSKLSNMNGGSLNHLPLVHGLKDSYIRQRVAREEENLRMMEEAINNISKHARAAERTKAYHKPRYNDITPINVIYSQNKTNHEYKHNFRGNNKSHNSKPEENKNNQALECYYCIETHYINNCTKVKAGKYKLTTQQVRKKYLVKFRQRIQKKKVSINETALDNDPEIDQGYTKEEVEYLCNFLVDTDLE